MSDAVKHECGIAQIRLLKPLEYYKEKYGSAFYGVNKMYLMMEKQHNRGQDGAGFASIKLDTKPGERYISRVRSIAQQPIPRSTNNHQPPTSNHHKTPSRQWMRYWKVLSLLELDGDRATWRILSLELSLRARERRINLDLYNYGMFLILSLLLE